MNVLLILSDEHSREIAPAATAIRSSKRPISMPSRRAGLSSRTRIVTRRSACLRARASQPATTCTAPAIGTALPPTTVGCRRGTIGCALQATTSCRSASCIFAVLMMITASVQRTFRYMWWTALATPTGFCERASGFAKSRASWRPRPGAGPRPIRVFDATVADATVRWIRERAGGPTPRRGCCSRRWSRPTIHCSRRTRSTIFTMASPCRDLGPTTTSTALITQ